MPIKYLSIVLLSVFMSTGAQLVLKVGANRINERLKDSDGIGAILLAAINMPIFFGLCIYVISAATWIWVLTKVEISTAYPFISLGFILTLGFGVALFGETLNANKIIGTVLIIAGCLFIAKV